jgi:hypothetical protein
MQAFVLKPWILSGLLTISRTVGEIGLNKNGGQIDIWIRQNGKVNWIAINRHELEEFLNSQNQEIHLTAESDGNAELAER